MTTFTFLLGVILIILKIAGIDEFASMSWWLVFLPFYYGYVIAFGLVILTIIGSAITFICGALFYATAVAFEYIHNWYHRKSRKHRK